MENNKFKSGYIGLIGRTNVGKSTLINKIFDSNIVITSDKAQTTRNRINCIYNTDSAQAIFVDCPGFFKPRNLLGEKLNRIIFQVLDDVDIIVAMVDFHGGIGIGDYYVFEQIKKRNVPKMLILNKIDLLDTAGKYSLLETITKIKSEMDFFEEVIPVSASTGENLEKLLKILMKKLPNGPKYYPGGMVTDMPVNKMIAEIIREKLSANLFDELPHSINVEVVKFQTKGDGSENDGAAGKGDSLVKIECNIYVEKKSHKAMIIGKSGTMLKKVGGLSRAEIEKLLQSKVFLQLWVKVEENWTRKEAYLDKFGY